MQIDPGFTNAGGGRGERGKRTFVTRTNARESHKAVQRI
jgi:hypothetical protein